jgi:hypothetical protein
MRQLRIGKCRNFLFSSLDLVRIVILAYSLIGRSNVGRPTEPIPFQRKDFDNVGLALVTVRPFTVDTCFIDVCIDFSFLPQSSLNSLQQKKTLDRLGYYGTFNFSTSAMEVEENHLRVRRRES